MTTTAKERQADRVIRFVSNLTHTKGKWARKPFHLYDFQVDIINKLFAEDETGKRITKTAFVYLPRKNGKTELMAAIALYMLCADGEYGAEILSAANTRRQASLVFDAAATMVRNSKFLSKHCKILDSTKRILYPATNSFYCAIPAEDKQNHGWGASCVIYDEIHEAPSRRLWDVLRTSTGAREQPLIVAITTAGSNKNTICYELFERAKKIQDGTLKDETFLPILYMADEQDDWKDEKTWFKANPALDRFRSLEQLRQEAKEARESAIKENVFRRLYLNQWTDTESRWISSEAWEKCCADVDPVEWRERKLEELKGEVCYAGLDLSYSQDISSFVLLFPKGNIVLPWFWVPNICAEEIELRDGVPYRDWENNGFVKLTDGNVIDYEEIYNTISELNKQYAIKEVAFDRRFATQLTQNLQTKDMIEVVGFGQGWVSMNTPTKELERLVLKGEINHGQNPVLKWMCGNTAIKSDDKNNIHPVKAENKSHNKTDGIIALIMALGRAQFQPIDESEKKQSVYSKGESLFI